MTHPAGTAVTPFTPLGFWVPDGHTPSDEPAAFRAALGDLRSPVVVVRTNAGFAVASGESLTLGKNAVGGLPVVAYLPPLPPEQLGDPAFLRDNGLRYPYMTGAMANGIGSVEV